MDHTTCGSTLAAPAMDAADPQPQSEQTTLHATVAEAVSTCSRLAPLALAAYVFALTAWQARHDPWNLAFILGAYAALAGLLLCLRRAERLAPDADRRRLHFLVWALSASLSCAFAYRVALLVPAAPAVVVWCMTSFVVLFGFYLLVLCNNDRKQCRSLDDVVDCGAAGDGSKPLLKSTCRSDEIV